jgi:hypothetical protein
MLIGGVEYGANEATETANNDEKKQFPYGKIGSPATEIVVNKIVG